ncbi:MAG: RtcB family protein [Candidatus Moraniibacteriota bacterium]|jgi:tRNA-splicing ligase RtcB (3'-phosphate/5'-hydroxy nucleic acid ligase)
MSDSTNKYKKNTTKLSEHQSDFKTDKMKVPARYFMSDDLLPDEETFAKSEDIASNDGLFRHTVAMPDVSSKPGRKNASGTTIVSDEYILPQVNDSDPNCGMRLVKTNLHENNITEDEIQMLFEQLVPAVPTKAYVGTKVPFDVVTDICRKGTSAAIDYLDIKTKNELENTQNGGNFFSEKLSRQDIFDVIPKLYLHIAKYRLGLLGAAGNHFLDLMKVTDIVDEENAKKLGVQKGQYLFMIHTGSGILGQYTMYTHTAKKREHLSQSLMVTLGKMTFNSRKKDVYNEMQKAIKKHMAGDDSLLKYDANGPDGKLYMTARAAASNFGTANRATITHNINKTIQATLNRDPDLDLIYDMPHISITNENHFGEDVWVHRSNTSRAYGPSKMGHHPIYKETGEPAFIPSSMSTDAFICVGTDDNAESFYSAPHGTGKGVNSDEKEISNKEELFAKMEEKGVHLYNAKSSIVLNQDSARYKNIGKVIEGVEANGIAKVVAKMQPVSVIVY